MATTNFTPAPPAAQLDQFIFHPNIFEAENIPRRLPRADVARFLRERIDAATRLKALRQAEKVVDFYDLQEVCGHFKSLLERKEAAADALLRDIVLDRSLARVCAPPELTFARQYYTDLIGRASASPEFEELVWLNDALADPQGAARLRERLQARRAAGRGTDYQATLEGHKLEELEDLKLSRSQKANEEKERILHVPERPQRIEEEIKIYLTVEYGYLEYLQPWAARRLRRETWGEQPHQQVIFKEDAGLRAELADTFYRMSGDLARFPDLDPENQPSLRVRCLRAAAFFGKHLTLDDLRYVQENAGNQLDILSNE